MHDEGEAMIINLLLICVLTMLGWLFVIKPRRSAETVLHDLKTLSSNDLSFEENQSKYLIDVELERLGISDLRKQKSLRLRINLLPFVLPSAILILRALLGYNSIEGGMMVALFGFSVGVFISRKIQTNLKKSYYKRIEFYLPIAMERIVMAVESGLDLIPALKALIQLEKQVGDPNDPTTGLFKQVIELSEAGMRFEQALEEVGKQVEGSSLRHAFVHLALAHKEGGEIISPLRELSDATQMQFQEQVEEHIAKLPVKATVPLLVMFIGLLICFLTPPAIQVMSVTGEMGKGIKSSQESGVLRNSKGVK